MKAIPRRVKVAVLVIGVFMLGVVTNAATFAVMPNFDAVINACRSNSTGQLTMIGSSANCATSETNVKWDKGMIAYGHINMDYTNTPYTIDQSRSSNIKSVVSDVWYTSPNDGMVQAACIELDDSIDPNSIRSITATGSDVYTPAYYKSISGQDIGTFETFCGVNSPADVVVIAGQHPFDLSVY